uniref:Uncharacterized protein n=1 Tax=Timema genevievae TaxID=629358 RepID=A0A7R9K4X6_TIMGE|nr:unnamed protein product [Timema genevievae]
MGDLLRPLSQVGAEKPDDFHYVGDCVEWGQVNKKPLGAISTVTTLESFENVRTAVSSESIAFNQEASHSLKYVCAKPVIILYAGLCLLEVLLSHYKLPLSVEQQSDIMSSLQHPDHSFRVKTLELLCSTATCSSAHIVSSEVVRLGYFTPPVPCLAGCPTASGSNCPRIGASPSGGEHPPIHPLGRRPTGYFTPPTSS